ncbi:hypothetical protein [uncultured Methylobacterium sp.]|uniref:hypothetical protein n=1 Tax=uncultured Methylobacterium sp. TaxID=157278 RepID=UPI0035CC9FC7
MTITTKAALADELGVTRPRVSQYVKAGMPVRADGKLNRDEALNWLNRNTVGLTGEDKGSTRAQRLVKDRRPAKRAAAPQIDPAEMAVDLLSAVLRQLAPYVAGAAIDAGCPMQAAYHVDMATSVAVSTIGERFLAERGVEPFASGGGDILESLGLTAAEPDWQKLAVRAGEPHDEDAWSKFSARLPLNVLNEPGGRLASDDVIPNYPGEA